MHPRLPLLFACAVFLQKWLSGFVAHPLAVPVAKAVLESAADNVSPFYAVITIRDVLIRRWDTTAKEYRPLRYQLLDYAEAQYDT